MRRRTGSWLLFAILVAGAGVAQTATNESDQIPDGDYHLPEVPAPGDRVMIFSGRDSIDPDGEPIALFNENIVIERANGSIELPQKLRRDAALSRCVDLAAVRGEVAKRRSEL